jgi:hypothetical protein
MKSLYQKLIKIDILLSHVQLNKISMVTSPSKLNKTKKYMPKIGPGAFLAEWGLDSLLYV